MKKIFILLALIVPFYTVNAEKSFTTENGTVLSEEALNFIKDFGYTESMIYKMTEDELEIFAGADLSTVKTVKKEFPNPYVFLNKNGKLITFDSNDPTLTTSYKTITGSVFYNSSASRYQFFGSISFHTVPSDAKKKVDFFFLNWGSGVRTSYFQVNAYYIGSSGVATNLTATSYQDVNLPGHYGSLSGVITATELVGIDFFLPKNKGVSSAVIGMAQGFSGRPTSTYVENLDQYKLLASVNQASITNIYKSASGYVYINNSSTTNGLSRHRLAI